MKDFRTWLAEYQEAYPQEVIHVDKEISAKWDVTSLVIQGDKQWREPPMFIFHNIVNHLGVKSSYPHVVNLMASRTRGCRIMGTDTAHYIRTLYEKAVAGGKKPVVVSRREAPVKEVVKTGKDIDLFEFGALVHHVLEPGPYISFGYATVYDSTTGNDNSTIQRGWIAKRNEIHWWPNVQSDNRRIIMYNDRQGKDTRFCFWLGHHPAALLGCNMGVAPGASHYEAAGGALGEPLRVVPSETLGKDFMVPAEAEIVIEGIVPANKRKPEGPFGEAWGHTGGQRWNPFVEVTCVTHRKNAFWLSSYMGHRDEWSGLFADKRSMMAFELAKKAVPSVLDVRNMGYPGTVLVQIAKERPGEALEAGLVVAASKYGMKLVIVLDDDIDIYDDEDIWLALSSRVQWDRDIHVIPGGRGAGTDPSLLIDGVTAKIIIDATKPLPTERPFSSRNTVPAEVLKRVLLKDYVPELFERP